MMPFEFVAYSKIEDETRSINMKNLTKKAF